MKPETSVTPHARHVQTRAAKDVAEHGMIVAGVMSGTSADGVDVAVCRISAGTGQTPRIEVLGHQEFAYSRRFRAVILQSMDARCISVADLSRLNWRLGMIYSECVRTACAGMGILAGVPLPDASALGKMARTPGKMSSNRQKLRLSLVGCHGQTLYHQATASRYLGQHLRCTWQTGESAVLAEQLRTPVVSDFRAADLAAGGQGAPLVAMLDWVMFRSPTVGRVLQNLGGIGNMTAIPAGAPVEEVIAFDTGPGNMVIDYCMRSLYGREYDREGAVARRGKVLSAVVDRMTHGAYFSFLPPKSCGREQFGDHFGEAFVRACRKGRASDADVVATASALTARTVVLAYEQFVSPFMGDAPVEYAVAGGGARNLSLMEMLRKGLQPLGVTIREMEELGVAIQAKEAVAFALLAWLTWQGQVGNVAAATGAGRGVVLGKVCFG